jgi:hypothetical protein
MQGDGLAAIVILSSLIGVERARHHNDNNTNDFELCFSV